MKAIYMKIIIKKHDPIIFFIKQYLFKRKSSFDEIFFYHSNFHIALPINQNEVL